MSGIETVTWLAPGTIDTAHGCPFTDADVFKIVDVLSDYPHLDLNYSVDSYIDEYSQFESGLHEIAHAVCLNWHNKKILNALESVGFSNYVGNTISTLRNSRAKDINEIHALAVEAEVITRMGISNIPLDEVLKDGCAKLLTYKRSGARGFVSYYRKTPECHEQANQIFDLFMELMKKHEDSVEE